jgi:NTE family protein
MTCRARGQALEGVSPLELGVRRGEDRRRRVRHRTLPLPDLLGSGIYVGGSAEAGRITDRFDGLPSPGTLWSGSVFLGADTFLGPLFLGLGVGKSGNWSLYFLVGAP